MLHNISLTQLLCVCVWGGGAPWEATSQHCNFAGGQVVCMKTLEWVELLSSF